MPAKIASTCAGGIARAVSSPGELTAAVANFSPTLTLASAGLASPISVRSLCQALCVSPARQTSFLPNWSAVASRDSRATM